MWGENFLNAKRMQLLGCFILFAGRGLTYNEIFRRAWVAAPLGRHTLLLFMLPICVKNCTQMTEAGLS